MKNFKFSALAMLSVIAMTFTSCLGDGDNTQYITGTGTATSTSSIMMDYGMKVNTSSISLNLGDRVYIYASVDGDEYDQALANLNANGRAEVTLLSVYSAGSCVTSPRAEYVDPELDYNMDYATYLQTTTAKPVEDVSWLSFNAFGNGYLNFQVDAEFFTRTSNNTSTTVEPNIELILKSFNASTKKLELVLVYDNREDEVTGEDGKLLDGYTRYSNYSVPVSINVSNIYYQLRSEYGLDDDDEINLSIEYVVDEKYTLCNSSEVLTSTFYNQNYCTVASFRHYYGY